MVDPDAAPVASNTSFDPHAASMPYPSDDTESLPPIAALFLVVFDRKVGYKIAWQRCLPDSRQVHPRGAAQYADQYAQSALTASSNTNLCLQAFIMSREI